MTPSFDHDVIVVGGGPAGSVMGWLLAKQGIDVAILERMTFPRDKVCGDYVEPGGLRILERLGVLDEIESEDRRKIRSNRIYFGPRLAFKGPIEYYRNGIDDIDYGLIIRRRELDAILLQAAGEAGAHILAPADARTVRRENGVMHVDVRTGNKTVTLRAPLIVGADGVQSHVAASMSIRSADRRHVGVSQRIYVKGVEVDEGEATIWFDPDIAPGYGWMFPMQGGIANVGVGLASETQQAFDISVPKTFEAAIERLRIRHPGCAKIEPVGHPLGGIVRTYSGITRNHFDGVLLIGDAGSFVDPVTGEGITQGMESAILALPTLMDALHCGRFETNQLARFDQDFRRYFDPSMRYLEVSAALLSNSYLSEFWLRVGEHGHKEALNDPAFARIAGAIFGGPSLQPLAANLQMWIRVVERAIEAARPRGAYGAKLHRRFTEDALAFQRGWARSQAADARGHNDWLKDVAARLIAVQKTLWTRPNPRPAGAFRFIGVEDPLPFRTPSPLMSPEVRTVLLDGAFRLIRAGANYFSAPTSNEPPQDAQPRRRWRIKT